MFPRLVVLATRSSNEYGCTFFQEAEVNGIVSICTTPILVFLLCKLRRMNDAFKLRREMCWTYYTALVLSSEGTSVCIHFGSDKHTGAGFLVQGLVLEYVCHIPSNLAWKVSIRE